MRAEKGKISVGLASLGSDQEMRWEFMRQAWRRREGRDMKGGKNYRSRCIERLLEKQEKESGTKQKANRYRTHKERAEHKALEADRVTSDQQTVVLD
jgi:hypothetical protein